MSIFPTKILLATDGSKEAELASRMAICIANGTNSELHVVHIGRLVSFAGVGPYAESDPEKQDEVSGKPRNWWTLRHRKSKCDSKTLSPCADPRSFWPALAKSKRPK
jgi:Universal stress protein family